MKEIIPVMNYSFKIYKKLFWKFTLLSLLITIPHFIFSFFVDENIFTKPFSPNLLWIAMGYLIFEFGYTYVLIPLVCAYMIMKTYMCYTEMVGKGLYKLQITGSALMQRVPGLVLYTLMMTILGILMFLSVIPGFFLILYYVLGYDTLKILFPSLDFPFQIDYWSGLFNFFLSLGTFLWLGYIFARWMFGMQAIFIENYRCIPSVQRSYAMTHHSVKLISITAFIAFLFALWCAAIFILPGMAYVSGMGKNLNEAWPLASHAITLMGALTTPFFMVVMTLTYIRLKVKKDALGLEFKMLSLLDKGVSFDPSILALDPEPTVKPGFFKAGIMARFTAAVIDAAISFILWCLLLYAGLAFAERGYLNPFARLYPYLPVGNEFLITVLMLLISYLLLHIGYMTFSEWLTRGFSPGKQRLGIQVTDRYGNPPKFWQSLLRNSFLLVDFLPFLYVLGFLIQIIRRDEKRLGDLVAGTQVVLKIAEVEGKKEVLQLWGSNVPRSKNRYPLTDLEYAVLSEFLDFNDLSPERRAFFAYNLNIYFTKKFMPQTAYQNPYDFFRELIQMNRP